MASRALKTDRPQCLARWSPQFAIEQYRVAAPMSNTPKSLMRNYAEGALISRELHDMMHQDAADARFDVELGGYEDRHELMRRMYAVRIRKEKAR